MAFYSCPHTYIDGRICGKGSYRQEGCPLHWKMRLRNPCKECGIPTASIYCMCVKHAGKYRNKSNYHKKKQAELRAKIVMLENHIPDLLDSRHEV
ncbi:hypothetical protein G9A89_004534 [Geosiphon pyriformis]|nr:hypothetical protein G9A89_004534 [Geosiphon pyriformis]